MSNLERDNPSSDKGDSDEDRGSDKNEPNTYQPKGRTGGSVYDTVPNAGITPGDSANNPVIYTKSVAETENYLDTHGIDLCKNPNIIHRTLSEREIEHEQRICVRYLQPPPPLPHGPLYIEEIERPTPSVGSTLLIREQAVAVDSAPPLVLRERPPIAPQPMGPEKRTVIIPTGTTSQRSVIIERYAPIQDKPRDIIIERWLPYAPQPEREVIRTRVPCTAEPVKPTCTIINYDNPRTRVTRNFAVVDVYNADPEDYAARYRGSLLDSRELLQEVRRAGVTEDITSKSALSVGRHVERKRVDYRQSRDSFCDCFSERAAYGKEVRRGARSSYIEDSKIAGVTSSIRHERHSNYRSLNNTYVHDE